jgi:hypothetical protein
VYIGGPTEAPVYPVPVAPVRPQKGSSTALNVLLGLGLVVAIGGIAFAAGRLTAPASASTASTNGGTGANGGFGGRFGNNPNASFVPGGFTGRAAGGLALEGTVTAVDASGITIQTTSGQSITVGTTSSTTYQTASSGTSTDAAVGSTVLVQLDPTTGGFGGGGFGGGGFGNGNGGGNFPGGPNASANPGTNPVASQAPNASPRALGDAKNVIVLPK